MLALTSFFTNDLGNALSFPQRLFKRWPSATDARSQILVSPLVAPCEKCSRLVPVFASTPADHRGNHSCSAVREALKLDDLLQLTVFRSEAFGECAV